MRTVAVLQARMGNSRLPGKNGLMLMGKPQVWHVLNRVQKAKSFHDIILAVPYETNGGIQIEAARSLGIETLEYRGDPNDLVHRYTIAADIMAANIVVRIPCDNTFIDADEIDRVVSFYNVDPAPWNWLTTNLDRDVLQNGYPGGLGAEVYDVRFLQWLDKTLTDKRLREHPHRWAFENHHLRTLQAPADIARPWMDFSVNTWAEWEWTKKIYEALYPSNPDFRIRDILKWLDSQEKEAA